MHSNLINVAVIGYVGATGLALAYLVQRHDLVHRLSVLAALAGWAVHSVALVVRSAELHVRLAQVLERLGVVRTKPQRLTVRVE